MGRKGAILVFVLLIILVVVILSNVALAIINSQNRLTLHQVSRIRAYYAAQAAMNLTYENLRPGGVWAPGNTYRICQSIPICTAAPFNFPGCDVIDNDLPFCTTVTVANTGTSIDGVGSTVTITTTYTYTPQPQ